MKKKKLRVFLILPFFAFILLTFGLNTVKATDVTNDGNSGNWTPGNDKIPCDSRKQICRTIRNSEQFLYASLTNDAKSTNYKWKYRAANSSMEANVAELNRVHDEITMNRDTVCDFISKFGYDCNSTEICDLTGYIYFAITAPFFENQKNITTLTVKEVARKCLAGADCSLANLSAMSRYFYVTDARTGVYSPAPVKTKDASEIANITSGHGVSAIKLTDFGICTQKPDPNICHGNSVTQTGSLNQCTDQNSNVSSGFKDAIVSKPGTGSKNGKKEYDIGDYCSLYCMEVNAEASLPGGFAHAISIGTSIVWPTSPNTFTSQFGNMYPLEFKGQRRCYVQVAPNLTYGKMCTIDPVDDYTAARTPLEKNTGANYQNNDARNKTNYANILGGRGITSVNNLDKLSWTNEKIRQQSNACTKPAGDDKPSDNPANTCADSAFWNYYRTTAQSNSTVANTNYSHWAGQVTSWKNSNHGTYHASKKWCEGASGDSGSVCETNGGTWHDNPAYCTGSLSRYHISGTSCIPYEEDAGPNGDGSYYDNREYWRKRKDAWSAAVGAINNRYTNFTKYVHDYREAVNVYLRVKLCSDYSKNEIACSGSSCNYYNFSTGASLKYEYEDGKVVDIGSLGIEQDVNYTCDNCGKELAPMKDKQHLYANYQNLYNANPAHLKNMIKQIEGNPINMYSGTVKYALPESLQNKYINKETLEVTNTVPNNANYVLIAFRNLPTSFNNRPGVDYDLVLYNLRLGHNGIMNMGNTSLNWLPNGEYICHYEVTTTGADCLCPPGTKNAGVDLYQAVLDEHLTCADAKEKYCDAGNVPECTENCVSQKFCPTDNTIEITGCVNSGMSYSECVQKLCYDDIYRCPPGTFNANMNMTNCVHARVANGMSIDQAKAYCTSKVCNLDQLVIYRTIDLRNPFPSIDADDTALRNWPPIKAFNLDIHGRHPGYNWNGITTVHNRILLNRKVDNYEVYKEKPLYHFELDTATILRIREYNRRQAETDDGYNDYTLDCVQDESNTYVGTACISHKFVHDPNYGGDTTGAKSVCGNAQSYQSLVNCLSR